MELCHLRRIYEPESSRTENPGVGGSIPSLPTSFSLELPQDPDLVGGKFLGRQPTLGNVASARVTHDAIPIARYDSRAVEISKRARSGFKSSILARTGWFRINPSS